MNKAERFRRLTCTQELRKDLRGSSVRAAAFTWAAGAVDFLLRIGSTAILARLVLPEQFGLVMMVTAVTAIADQFRDLGLSTATVQRKEISHEEVSNLFWINVSAGVLITLVICGLSPAISAYYKEPRLTVLTCVLAANFIWGGLMVQHQALLARQLKLGHSATVRVLASVLSTALAILLAWFGFGYWALVWREFARCALLAVGMWLCCPWIPGLPSRKTDVREFIGFGAHLSAANILASISGGADRILLGRFWGPGPVAMYRQAYQLLVLPMEQLLSPVYQVTQPGLSMLQTDAARFRRFYQKVLTVACVASMPLSLFVAVYATEITRGLLGRKWVDSGPILMILSIGAFIRQPVSCAAFVLIARGRSKAYLGLTTLQNMVTVAAMALGVYWGAAGVAIAGVAATYVLIPPTLHYCFKESPVTIGSFFATIVRPVVASLTMTAALVWLRFELGAAPMLVSLTLGCVVALVVFLGAWMATPGGRVEVSSLMSDLRLALRRKAVPSPVGETVAAAN
ncbi:MAG: lipopolysaccharide biosynthesis protein [Verrucomicrobiota bacterium]